MTASFRMAVGMQRFMAHQAWTDGRVLDALDHDRRADEMAGRADAWQRDMARLNEQIDQARQRLASP